MEGDTGFAKKQYNNYKKAHDNQGSNEESYNASKAQLVEIIDNLFDPANLVKNAYLTYRSLSENFDVPTRAIYQERSITNITYDKLLINAALESAKNVILNKNGDFINSVRPNVTQIRRKIVIENIPKEKQDALKSLVQGVEGEARSKIVNMFHIGKASTFNIICKDDSSATQISEALENVEFEGQKLTFSIVPENLLQAAQDFLSRKFKEYNQQSPAPYGYNQNFYAQPYQVPNYYNPYGGYAPYMMAMPPAYGQGYYPGMDYNMYQGMQNPMYTQQVPYNNNNPGNNQTGPDHYKKPYNPNYRNDKKPYVKRQRQPRDNDNQYENKLSTKSSSIEVNDNEFPALN